MKLARRSLDPALAPFLWSRAAIWAGAVLFYYVLRPGHPYAHGPTPGGRGYWLHLWANWDGAWFEQVARHGYDHEVARAAFYPLYPWLVGGLGRIFFGHYVAAGVVVSLAAAAAAFVLLRRLTALELGEDAARRATVLLALFPLSFFLQAVYSESVFLALALAAFYAARRERWTLAAGATALAFLARPTAFALWVGVLVLAWQSPLRRRALAWVTPTPLAFGIYPLVLWQQSGDALAFAHAEKYWHRTLSSLGPLGGIVDGTRAAAHGVHAILVTPTPPGWTYPANLDLKQVAAVNVEAFAWLVVFLVLTVVAWRRLGASYGAFAALSLALPLSEPWNVFPLFSLPRFGLVVFPLFMALATLTRSRRTYAALIAVSTLGLAIDIARWSLWKWVA